MSWMLRKLMARGGYMEGEDGGDASGGGGGAASIAAALAAKAEADKAAADADKAAADAAAADAAKATGDTKVSDAEAKLIKEVMDKKTKLKSIEEDNKKLKDELKKFEGIDLDSVKALLNERKATEDKKLEDKGEWDRLRAQMAEENGKQVKTVTDQLTAAQIETARLAGVISELTVGNAFVSSSFIKDELVIPATKVRALYGSHFEFADGSLVAYDKPAGANERTMLVDAKGDPLNFEAAMKKIVDTDPDRDQLLKSKMKPGAGSVTKPGARAPAQKFDQPTGIDKISAALSKGQLQK